MRDLDLINKNLKQSIERFYTDNSWYHTFSFLIIFFTCVRILFLLFKCYISPAVIPFNITDERPTDLPECMQGIYLTFLEKAMKGIFVMKFNINLTAYSLKASPWPKAKCPPGHRIYDYALPPLGNRIIDHKIFPMYRLLHISSLKFH
jgi:hypothetical protein